MRVIELLLAIFLPAAASAARMCEAVGRAVPIAGSRVYTNFVSAAAGPDSSVWIVWGQETRAGHPPIHSQDEGPDVGLFCRLISSDGSDILPPTQIIGPVYSHTYHDWIGPVGFQPLVQPNEGLLVFSDDVSSEYEREWRPPEDLTTSIIAIDRHGNIGKATFDNHMVFDRFTRGGITLPWWCWFDSAGNVRCIYMQHNGVIRHATIHGEGADMESRSTLYRAAKTSEDSVNMVRANPGTQVRCHLDWAREIQGGDFSDVTPVGHDTLLVAYVPRAGPIDYRIQEGWWPGDTLVIYRFHVEGLSLIDSSRVPAKSVAGSDFAGTLIPRSILQKAPDGFVLFIRRREGTASYRLDARGNPVAGKRMPAGVAPESSFADKGRQEYLITQPGGPTKGDVVVDWFGFAASGALCHESYRRPNGK